MFVRIKKEGSKYRSSKLNDRREKRVFTANERTKKMGEKKERNET